jgi:hypothetical protein
MKASMTVTGISSVQKRISFAVGIIPEEAKTVRIALISPIS